MLFYCRYKKIIIFVILKYAQMAKLVDALVSGTSISNDVQVRFLFWAPTKPLGFNPWKIIRQSFSNDRIESSFFIMFY